MTNKEHLICIDVKLSELKKQFSNHLTSHARYTYLIIASTIGIFASLFMLIFKGR